MGEPRGSPIELQTRFLASDRRAVWNRAVLCIATLASVLTATTAAAPTQQPRRLLVVSRDASWFPGGERVVFESNLAHPARAVAQPAEVAFDDPGLDVFSVRVDGSGLRNLTADDPEVAHVRPSVSPDGTRIAFLRRATVDFELVVMAADGSAKRVLASRVRLYRPAWSPDGRVIAFSACCEADRRGLYLVDADGGAPRPLAEGGASAWSPDGSRLAFIGSLLGNPTLFVTDRGGAAPRRLAGSVEGEVISWSPDSRRIAYQSLEQDVRSVGVVSAEGGVPLRLVRGRHPSWSSDGRRIAFAGEGIQTVDVDSGVVHTLAERGREPAWSPDAARLVYVTGAEVGSYLEVVRADGSGRTRITPESPLAVQTVVPAASVSRPDELTIPIVVDTPDAVRPGGVVTARVTVETALLGNRVDGANVSVRASRGTTIRPVPRVARTIRGQAILRVRLLRVPRRARVVRLFFVASKPGDTTVSSYPYDVPVTLARRR